MNLIPTTRSDERTIHLSDGRSLGYAEYGDPEGKPIFHFNGYPGTRFEAKVISDAAVRAGVRIIGIDRPGMGLSDFQPDRQILDWPDDVIELADALRLDRFSTVGVSGGGLTVQPVPSRFPIVYQHVELLPVLVLWIQRQKTSRGQIG